MKKLRNILFCLLLSSLFSNKNSNFHVHQGFSRRYPNSEYNHESQRQDEKINKFFECHLRNKIKEKKSFRSRFKQYGEPHCCLVSLRLPGCLEII